MALAERDLQNRHIYRNPNVDRYKKKQHQSRKRPHKGIYIIKLLFIALTAFMLVSQFSTITEKQYRVEKLQAELKDTEAQNDKLRVEIANLKSVSRIDDIAKNKLNMIEPHKQQIIYLYEN